jgi:hypothetical protein
VRRAKRCHIGCGPHSCRDQRSDGRGSALGEATANAVRLSRAESSCVAASFPSSRPGHAAWQLVGEGRPAVRVTVTVTVTTRRVLPNAALHWQKACSIAVSTPPHSQLPGYGPDSLARLLQCFADQQRTAQARALPNATIRADKP